MSLSNDHKSIIPIDSMGHDIVEILGCHKTVIVQVRLHEHLIELLFGHILAQVMGHPLQVSNRDLATSGGVKGGKDFVDLGSAVLFAELCSRQF